MLVEERRQRVLDLLQRRGFLTLADLSAAVQASESTVRRDLEHWQKQGLLKRIHGGAMFVGDSPALPPFEERSGRQTEEKRRIAQTAARRVRDGDAVLIDGGTTTLEVARLLVGRPLQVVTNSLPVAQLFANGHNADLIILGGYVYSKTAVALGPLTIRQLEDIHVHHAIMGISGITAKGLFNSNLLLVETQRQMMRCADAVTVVADHTKVGRSALAQLCELGDVDTLVVDDRLSPEQRAILDDSGVRLVLARETANGSADEEFLP